MSHARTFPARVASILATSIDLRAARSANSFPTKIHLHTNLTVKARHRETGTYGVMSGGSQRFFPAAEVILSGGFQAHACVSLRFRSAPAVSLMVSRMPNGVHTVSSWTVTQGIAWPDAEKISREGRESETPQSPRALIRGGRARRGRGRPGAPSNYGVAINLIKPELMYGCCSFRLRARRALLILTSRFRPEI